MRGYGQSRDPLASTLSHLQKILSLSVLQTFRSLAWEQIALKVVDKNFHESGQAWGEFCFQSVREAQQHTCPGGERNFFIIQRRRKRLRKGKRRAVRYRQGVAHRDKCRQITSKTRTEKGDEEKLGRRDIDDIKREISGLKLATWPLTLEKWRENQIRHPRADAEQERSISMLDAGALCASEEESEKKKTSGERGVKEDFRRKKGKVVMVCWCDGEKKSQEKSGLEVRKGSIEELVAGLGGDRGGKATICSEGGSGRAR